MSRFRFTILTGHWLRCVLLCLAAMGCVPVQAQDTFSPESVKAAYLFHFAGYVEWPAAPSERITIGVLGDHGVAAELRRIIPGRAIDGRSLRVQEVDSGHDLAGIQILYVGRGGAENLPALAQKARQQGVLLVSDAEDGLNQGAVVNFITADNRVRFEISLRAADDAGLKLSSRLLSAAVRLKRSFWSPPRGLAGGGGGVKGRDYVTVVTVVTAGKAVHPCGYTGLSPINVVNAVTT
jgi:hypothetical protein